MVAQPAKQAAEVAACEGLVQAAQIGVGLGVKLSRIEITQRVGREIAEKARRSSGCPAGIPRRRCEASRPGSRDTSRSRPRAGR